MSEKIEPPKNGNIHTLPKRKKPRIWRNWFGLRCRLKKCPSKLTMSHEPFGWRCVICREIQGYFLED